MREDNKRRNILEEIQKANKTLEAANLLFDNGFVSDAISNELADKIKIYLKQKGYL